MSPAPTDAAVQYLQLAPDEDMLLYITEDTCSESHGPKLSVLRMAEGDAKPANGKTARMIASLAICVFSGLIFWVFRRGAGRKGKQGKKKKKASRPAGIGSCASISSTPLIEAVSTRQPSPAATPTSSPPHNTSASHPIHTTPSPPHPHPQQPCLTTSPPPNAAQLSSAATLQLPRCQQQTDMPTTTQRGGPAGQEMAGSTTHFVAVDQDLLLLQPNFQQTSTQLQQLAMPSAQHMASQGQQELDQASRLMEEELKLALQRAGGELQRTRAALEEAARRGQEASAAAEKLSKQLQQSTQEAASLRADLGQAVTDMQSTEAEARHGRVREAAMGDELQELRAEVGALRDKAGAAAASQATSAKLTQRVKELEGQVEALAVGRARDGREGERRLREAEEALDAAVSARVAAEADCDKVKERSADALKKVGSIQAEMARISSQLEALRGERDELRGVVQGERQARRNLETALAAERLRCRGLEVQQRAAQEAMRSMEGRIRALERRGSAEFMHRQGV